MDALITAAGRALAHGDPLGALKRIALRDDPPALALRGIAMAQLGDLERARDLVRRAARGFGPKEARSRARCAVAEAEIALAARDLAWPAKALESAITTLEALGDHVNATHARYLTVRRLLLIGHLALATEKLDAIDTTPLSSPLRAVHELLVAGIAIRRLETANARAALTRASRAGAAAGIPALSAEIENAAAILEQPAARKHALGGEELLRLDAVEALHASDAFVVDACRRVISQNGAVVTLTRRPVLFALARALGEAWPADVSREALIQRAFGVKRGNESHRARLRVEIGRLRSLLRTRAQIEATPSGFKIVPRADLVVLEPPVDGPHGEVLAMLADGQAWSSSALAMALGASQRTVQRALDALATSNHVRPFGRARARRWMASPLPGFTTTLLLPAPLPGS